MKKSLLLIAALALQSGCAKHEPAPTAQADAPAAPKAELGAFGLDLSGGNPEVKPGDDFFAFAGGKWYDTFEIPPDRSSYGPFHKLNDLSEERVKALIEKSAEAKPAAGTPEQKIGDYFASFMDEAGIEAKGLQPIETDLARIQAAKTKKDIATLFGLPGFMSTFGVGISPDLKNPSRYSIDVGQSGLGLPDRDYYLKDDAKLKEHRAKYVAYIEQMLSLGGVPDGAKKARNIMQFETALAKVQWPLEKRRDAEANYNPRTKAQLLSYAPGFDWQAFFDASDLGARDNFVIGPLTAVRDSAKVVDKTSVDTLKDYLTFHLLRSSATFLPKRFDEANFAFYGQQLRGQPQQRDRWKRGVALTGDALGEMVGQVYVKEYFPPESKAKMEVLVSNLRAALKERLATLSWMSAETRKRAEEKLGTFVAKIGYPDKWKDYSALEVKRDDIVGNVRRAAMWDWNRNVARLDQPVDRDEWFMNVTEINAYYNPLNNEIVFPAAILQPPFFDPAADDAVNYGGIGAVIGHEIGHGFDDQGRKFAPDGSLTDWWTKVDADAFGVKTKELVDQYSSFDALPGLKVNGATSLGENIGDLGGLNMAYEAYHNSLQGKMMEPLNMHELKARGPSNRAEELRLELYEKVNALGIGAQGLGGLSTVLDVKVNDFPTHAASKPVALLPNCAATRHAHFVLDGSGPVALDPPSLDDWPKLELDFAASRRVNLDTLTRAEIATWKSGETLLLSGKLLTGRDAAHKRLVEMMARGEKLPVDFTNRFIYYVGPVDAVREEAVGPAGPTTSSRMDKFVEPMLANAGLIGMVGKSERGPVAIESIRKHRAVYCIAVGGAAYLVSKSIRKSRVLAFEDLGMEAIMEFEVKDMPVTVAVDSTGAAVHKTGPATWRARIGKIPVAVV